MNPSISRPSSTLPWRMIALLGGKRQGLGNVLAALLGVVTPFCSCSAVPLFIGFVESGIPLGVTFSFLIAAPTIKEEISRGAAENAEKKTRRWPGSASESLSTA